MNEIPKLIRYIIRREDVGLPALFSAKAPRGYTDYLADEQLDEVIRRCEQYKKMVNSVGRFLERWKRSGPRGSRQWEKFDSVIRNMELFLEYEQALKEEKQ